MSSPVRALIPLSPIFLSPPPPEPDTTSTTDYTSPPPDLSSPPPLDVTGDYSPPPADLFSPPPLDATGSPVPADLSSPPLPDTAGGDYAPSPAPADLSSPPLPDTAGGDYAPPPGDLSSPPLPDATGSPAPADLSSSPPPDATGGDYTPPPSPPPLPEPDTYPSSALTPSPEVNSLSPSTYPPDLPPTTAPSPSSLRISKTPSPGGGSSRSSTGLVVGIVIGSVILVILTVVVLLIWNNKRKRRPQPTPPITAIQLGPKHEVGPARSFRSRTGSGGSGSHHSDPEAPVRPTSARIDLVSKGSFTYDELSRATDGFSTANFLGKGGFGYVHRGALPNGQEIAVKRLKTGSTQGEGAFQADVEIISRVHHKHLVSFYGFCITGLERMLVYEFVQNNTLEFHLHGKGRPTMDWPTRLKIALGAARGVAYLHEECHPIIIHRDIKASNILLDFNFEAKVADFGLAKFYPDDDTRIWTLVMGTCGYLAPEYANSGKLTEKSDVFSFGVVLLELITGRPPVDTTQTCMHDSLVGWARPLLTRALEDGNFDALIDPRLQMDYKQKKEMARIVACATACVRFSAKLRPPMSQVVRALEGNLPLSDLNEGIKPGHSFNYSSQGSSVNYDTTQYNEDMKNLRKSVLPTGDSGTRCDLYVTSKTTSE